MFTVWKFRDIQFIAVPRGNGVHVADQDENNYGAWRSVESFRERQQRGDELVAPIGKCVLSIRSVE